MSRRRRVGTSAVETICCQRRRRQMSPRSRSETATTNRTHTAVTHAAQRYRPLYTTLEKCVGPVPGYYAAVRLTLRDPNLNRGL